VCVCVCVFVCVCVCVFVCVCVCVYIYICARVGEEYMTLTEHGGHELLSQQLNVILQP
jgi:hypothetical protein